MSGHSKFANIKHKKEKNDAKKGKVFTVIGREIVMAVKAGGADPNNNSKLRDVIAKAKANNMPNDTIERGIKKAAGADSADSYERATYEMHLQKVMEASELRDVYPLCLIRKVRSSLIKKNWKTNVVRWMQTSL